MRISIKEAARMMQTSEEFVRLSIANGLIPGAMKVGRAYWVTDYQVQRVIEGRLNNDKEEDKAFR